MQLLFEKTLCTYMALSPQVSEVSSLSQTLSFRRLAKNWPWRFLTFWPKKRGGWKKSIWSHWWQERLSLSHPVSPERVLQRSAEGEPLGRDWFWVTASYHPRQKSPTYPQDHLEDPVRSTVIQPFNWNVWKVGMLTPFYSKYLSRTKSYWYDTMPRQKEY